MLLRNIFIVGVVGLSIGVCVSLGDRIKYPEVRRNESVVEDYFGTNVSDPYRWLEDMYTEETKEFVRAQNNLSDSWVEDAKNRNQIRDVLTKLWTYPKDTLAKKRGDNYFLYKNSGVQNQWVMYKSKTLEGVYKPDAEVFLDPNTFSSDGTLALRKVSFSKGGGVAAYTLSQSGSDWSTVHLRNVTTNKDFPEVLNFTKFTSIAWTHDNNGFFYTRYPQIKEEEKLVISTKNEKVYYHVVGTEQEMDKLVVEMPEHPDWSLGMELSDDGEYMLVSTYEVINEDFLFYARITDALKSGFRKPLKLIPIVDRPASYGFVANDGEIFYFITNEDAPNYKLIGMDVNNPDKKHWATIIPEHNRDVLSWAAPINNDKMMTSYMRDVKSTLELRNLRNGTLIKEFTLETGAIQSSEGRREDSEFYFKLATFTNPGVSYKLNLLKEPFQLEVFKRTAFAGLDTNVFETIQVFYDSKDGTKVPMFITKRKDVNLTGDLPTLMYGYGGFSSSNEPFFSIGFLAFVHSFNGIFALPNIRGGGEYGTRWWDEGRLLNKQNVFDDFHAAAEYLIRNNYTNPSKLTIQGASNGGLLIGACINQRPELYGAGIAEVGVMDMLRFQKFTVGAFWCGEYGCSENKTHFENLIKYSPLHNVRANTSYPAVLVTTADHDDRVVPLHSYKYIAELQHTAGSYQNQTQPLLIRVEEKAGHGHGKPTWKQIEEYVYTYSFMQKALDYKFVL